jgi:hypothetical protein
MPKTVKAKVKAKKESNTPFLQGKTMKLYLFKKRKLRKGEKPVTYKEMFSKLIGKAGDLPTDLSTNKYQ